MGAPVTPVALTGSDQLVYSGHVIYAGITVRETAAAPATVRVFDGTSATGTLLATIGLAAGQSVDLDHVRGIRAALGVYVDVTGAVEGSVRLA